MYRFTSSFLEGKDSGSLACPASLCPGLALAQAVALNNDQLREGSMNECNSVRRVWGHFQNAKIIHFKLNTSTPAVWPRAGGTMSRLRLGDRCQASREPFPDPTPLHPQGKTRGL